MLQTSKLRDYKATMYTGSTSNHDNNLSNINLMLRDWGLFLHSLVAPGGPADLFLRLEPGSGPDMEPSTCPESISDNPKSALGWLSQFAYFLRFHFQTFFEKVDLP